MDTADTDFPDANYTAADLPRLAARLQRSDAQFVLLDLRSATPPPRVPQLSWDEVVRRAGNPELDSAAWFCARQIEVIDAAGWALYLTHAGEAAARIRPANYAALVG